MLRLRNRHLLVLDALLLGLAPYIAFAVRFEGWAWSPQIRSTAYVFGWACLIVEVGTLLASGLYKHLWRYASVSELEGIFRAALLAALASIAAALLLVGFRIIPVRVPISVLVMNAMFCAAAIGLPRLFIRASASAPRRRQTDQGRRVLIAGAGVAGEMVLRELASNRDLGMAPVGFVDDDPTKLGHRLSGLSVFGALDDIPDVIQRNRIDEILIAMPRAPGAVVRKIVRFAYDAGIPTRTVPGLFDILSERVSVTAIREVRIEDLLRRDPVQTDLAAVATLAQGQTVLITGGGGSIGSELCRQILSLKPSKLIVLDHAENPVFDILNELRATCRTDIPTRIVAAVADVRDRDRINQIFQAHRPDAVFHAAAHKHVPLMEDNAVEAVTNNVLGTRNVVNAAVACGASHFVLISTDKAVRPTSVMGASKRVAEHVVHNAAVKHGRNFVAVRFGNVLGSQGSVLPMFIKQIRDGGPVTVTHPEMRRYFMTIPEAVQLVLQAGALGRGGELFMLDMGDPVKIVDLARDMIRLSGLEEGTDIDIAFTGVRPGEKLYEEMFFSHEVALPTEHPKVVKSSNGAVEHCDDATIEALIALAKRAPGEQAIREALKAIVPDFVQPDRDTPASPGAAVPNAAQPSATGSGARSASV